MAKHSSFIICRMERNLKFLADIFLLFKKKFRSLIVPSYTHYLR